MDSNDQELRDVLVVLHDLGTGEQRQVKSGEAGKFAFACVRDSKYRLTFSFSGFLTQSIDVMDYRYPQDVNLQVRMNFETTDNDFIWQGHLVVIEILDSARDAHIQDAKVIVAGQTTSQSIEAITDGCGKVWFYLKSGRYALTVTKPQFQERTVSIDIGAPRTITVSLRRLR